MVESVAVSYWFAVRSRRSLKNLDRPGSQTAGRMAGVSKISGESEDLSEVAVVRVLGDEEGLDIILRCCAVTLFSPKMGEAPNSDCLAAGWR